MISEKDLEVREAIAKKKTEEYERYLEKERKRALKNKPKMYGIGSNFTKSKRKKKR